MGKYFEELNVGDTFTTARRTITEADIALFAGLSGDYNPLHTDSVFAGKTVFKTRIAHGLLTLAVASGLHFRLGISEGTLIALLGVNKLRFVSSVRAGDTLHCAVKVKEKKESRKKDRGIVIFKDTVLNQKNEAILEYERVLLFKRKEPGK